nr:hypothetical protein [Roseomonas rosulenta]
MNPLQQIDALLPEQCIGQLGQRRQSRREVMPDIDDLCVSRGAIEGRHLWLNTPFLGGGRIFVSDTLLAAMRAKELKGFVVREVREL